MTENVPSERSCVSPQVLPGCEPNIQWLPEQLGTYAQTQYQQILDGETHLTRPYWRLGQALEIAKKSFGHANGSATCNRWASTQLGPPRPGQSAARLLTRMMWRT